MGVTTTLDYQVIINLAGTCIAAALPIGIVFGLAEKAVNAFLSMAFGKEKIKL